MSILKPSPSSPRRLATGTRQSSNISSAVSWVAMPIFLSFLPRTKPSALASITNSEMPLRGSVAWGSVFTATTARSQRMPLEMKVLDPLTT